MAVPQFTLTARLQNAHGELDKGAKLIILLCGYGTTFPRITNTSVVALVKYEERQGDDQISVTLYGNDQLTPAGTFYCIQVVSSKGDVLQSVNYQLTGNQSVDLSNLVPFDPQPPLPTGVNPVLLDPPGGALQTINGSITITGALNVNGKVTFATEGLYDVPYEEFVVFDGNSGSSFKLTLLGDVSGSSIANMNGKTIIAVRIAQDGAGNRLFTWPAEMRGAGEINPAPNAVSIQLFAVDEDGTMDAATDMKYSFPG